MAEAVVMIQEGQEPERRREALAAGLARIGRECFDDGSTPDEVRFVTIPRGFAWTAGEPSTSSLVIRSVRPGLALAERERFLRAVCDLWVDETGCSIEEIVVTAWDGPLPV